MQPAAIESPGIPAPRNSSAMVDMYACVDDRIIFYKTLNCHKMFVHDWSACPYKHKGEKARRRCLLEYNYSAKICPEMKERGECSKGDACNMTHSMFEYWMHPQKYRTTMCKDAPGCNRPFCFFAHNDREVRNPEEVPALLQDPSNTLPPETLSALPPGTLTSSGSLAAAAAAPGGLPHLLAAVASPGASAGGGGGSGATTPSAAGAAAAAAPTHRLSSPSAAGNPLVMLYHQQQQAPVAGGSSSTPSECSSTTCSGSLFGPAASDATVLVSGPFSSPMTLADSTTQQELLLPLSGQAMTSIFGATGHQQQHAPMPVQLLAAPAAPGAAAAHNTVVADLAARTAFHRERLQAQMQQQQQMQMQLQHQLHLHMQQQQQQQQQAAVAAALASPDSGLMQQLQQLGLDGQNVLASLSSPQRRAAQQQQQQQFFQQQQQQHAMMPAGLDHGPVGSSPPFLLKSISLPQPGAPSTETLALAPTPLLPAMHSTPASGGCLSASLATAGITHPGVKGLTPMYFELF